MSCARPRSPRASGPTITSPWAHALLSESREFERGVTAAVNASVQPLLERYVDPADAKELGGKGYRRRRAGDERQWRHGLVASGRPGGGEDGDVRARLGRDGGGLYRARARAMPNLITYDMGGTSTDVALIRDGEPVGLQRDRDRIRHADPRADGRRAHRRRRRRLDRAGESGRAAGGRAGKRRRRAGTDLLWTRRHRADDLRRQPDSWVG